MKTALQMAGVLLAITCWLVAVLHVAVLRDCNIFEPLPFESMRRVRVGAWVIAGLFALHGVGLWGLPVLALAMCDAISAVGRLWPMGHGEGDSHLMGERR